MNIGVGIGANHFFGIKTAFEQVDKEYGEIEIRDSYGINI